MKKIVFLLLFISTFGFAQDNIIFKKFNSYQLNTERILKIYLPDSYNENKEHTYPVAVVFDAEMLFDVYVANAKLFALKDKAPEQIVVGVYQNQNDERYEDCDYSEDSGLPNKESAKFYGFVQDELIPYIEENYRTSLFKTLVGQTITANFTNYFFIDNNPIFKAFININPSYAPNMNQKLEVKSQSITSDYFYYMSKGSFNTDERTQSINEVNNLLKLSDNELFHYKVDDFSNATKTASVGMATASAMGFIFKLFAAISKKEFEKNIAELTPGEAIEYLEKKYVEIEYLYGSNVKIRESDIYKIEPIVIEKSNGDYLEEFGKMILRLYPDSPIGDYYIGMYHETGYDYKRALKYYKNGYAKIGSDNPNADAYYGNIERVLDKQRSQKLGFPVGEEVKDEEENMNEDDNN